MLYDVADTDADRLDRTEGVVAGGYVRHTVQLNLADGRATQAMTYVAGNGYVDATRLPFDWYRALCVAGAVEHGLPAHYIEELQRAPAAPDPDAARAARMRLLLEG